MKKVWTWWKRRASWLAISFAALALVLVAVICVQAAMLHSRGWRMSLGTLPEYLAAVGSLATFGVLWFTAAEFRRGQRERRDREAGQAQLIVVEHVPYEDHTWGGSNPPAPGRRDVVIRNRSKEPVFGLHIEEYASGSDVRVFQRSARAGVRVAPSDLAVLAAGEATVPLGVLGGDEQISSTEHVEFSFTDPRQRRWRRRGNGQPERVLLKLT